METAERQCIQESQVTGIGTPDDVANLVAFVVSPEGRFLPAASSISMEDRPKPSKRSGAVAEFFVAFFALFFVCRFLWPFKANYGVDWYIHRWEIGYIGQYFRGQGFLPAVFNTTQWGGIPAPIFYGNLGFAVLGLFGSVLTSGTVIRLAVIFLFGAQYYLIVRAARQLDAAAWISHSVACLVIWATYPLTNIFNRGALTEFFATSLLVCTLSLAILLLSAPSINLQRRYASRMMLCFVLAAGTHPITAMFGSLVFALIVCHFFISLRKNVERRRSIIMSVLPWIPVATVCLAPWVYATLKFANDLTIRRSQASVLFLQDSWDNWRTRFYPLPWDPRVKPGTPLSDVWVPYLDAQINVPLLILYMTFILTVLFMCRRSIGTGRVFAAILTPLLSFSFFTWISLSLDSYHYLPSIFAMIQFAYRAVTYQNLALLLGIFLLLMLLRNSSREISTVVMRSRFFQLAALLCVVISAYGVAIKRNHIRAARTDRGEKTSLLIPKAEERQALLGLPPQYYGIADYTTPALFMPLTPEEKKASKPAPFVFDSNNDFGNSTPLKIELADAAWIRTNIHAFPWNRISMDGELVPQSDVRAYGEMGIAVHASKGVHYLTFEFKPDRTWQVLRVASLLTLMLWLIGEFAWEFRGRTP